MLKFVVKAFARLPFGVLYVLSDCIYVLLYYVVRYRRRLTARNLADCFGDLSEHERKAIARRFYRNFADYIVETVKLAHISDAEMRQRFTFSGVEIIDELMKSGRSVVAYFSHCGNWEWAPSVTLWSSMKAGTEAEFCQVYRPLRNESFDRLMLWLRGRFGSVSYPKRTVLRDLLKLKNNNIPSVTGFMSDQKPSHGDAVHEVTFFGRNTRVITGTETLARRLGMAAVYWDISKPSRGHYHIDVRLMSDNAADTPQYMLTDSYFKLLEETIRRHPDIWLWTHNRWKIKIAKPDLHKHHKSK